MNQPRLICIVGPTAVGKTAVGIALAERVNGEIISADAVAVYRGLNIGAAKPTGVERERVPFHLIDVVDPDDDFTLADFERQATAAIEEIRGRGRMPIVVGGTGLYVRSLTAVLTVPAVPPQPDLRASLWAEAETLGAPVLHARLAESDPLAAAKILPNDAKRIIRALEVLMVTGQPISAFHTSEGIHGILRPGVRLFGLRMERDALYRRIESRVDTMIAQGLTDEVAGLLAHGYPADLKSMQSLGYRHIAQVLSGVMSLEEAVAELKRDTRRYAKRQMSWFNADANVRWIDVSEGDSPSEIAMQIENLWISEDSVSFSAGTMD